MGKFVYSLKRSKVIQSGNFLDVPVEKSNRKLSTGCSIVPSCYLNCCQLKMKFQNG